MPLIRAIALNIIKSMVPLNLPGSQIIHYLQELNVAYRRTDMLFDIRKAYGRIEYETRVTGLKSESKVPEGWMSREKLNQPYNYMVHLKIDNYDSVTGDYAPIYRDMYQNDNLSVGDYADRFPDYGEQEGSPPLTDMPPAYVIGVTKNTFEKVPF